MKLQIILNEEIAHPLILEGLLSRKQNALSHTFIELTLTHFQDADKSQYLHIVDCTTHSRVSMSDLWNWYVRTNVTYI